MSRSRAQSGAGTSEAAQVRQQGRRIRFRPDIEGVRAVALFLALLCHGGLPLAAGGFIGVDMFFVISGFLITGLLVAEAQKTGTISLGRFYAHRMKRLLPLAALVLVVTVVGGLLLFPPARSDILSGDVFAAALHYVNWHFAGQSVDYFGPETTASPVMHYWSLSLEEQFYVVWALVLFAVVGLVRRRGGGVRNLRMTLLAIVLVIGIGSFLYSIHYSAESPNAAYYSTLTRAWQIAFGAALALIPLPRLSLRWCWVLSLAAFGLIAYATLSFSPSTVYPGWLGTVPVLAVGALIVAGIGTARSAPQRLLETRALVYIGGLSYAWYLWHYPVMIFGLAIKPDLGYLDTTALVLLAGLPAVASHHLIGQPLRYSKTLTRFPRRAVAVGSVASVAALAAALALVAMTPRLTTAPASDVVGASKLQAPKLQRSADAVSPAPTGQGARADRGGVWEAGWPRGSASSATARPARRSSCSATPTRCTSSPRPRRWPNAGDGG
jgi:peptidoglycan/LPS O-acetylase OafA/YrhL